MHYEAPKIVRRERVDALLSPLVVSNTDSVASDVNSKDNIVAVVW
jgi:hypothetical protein